jgi:ribonuclease Y
MGVREIVLIALGVGGIFYILGVIIERWRKGVLLTKANEMAEKIVEEAKKEAKKYKTSVELEAKVEWNKKRNEFEQEIRRKDSELSRKMKDIEERDRNLDRRADFLKKREIEVNHKELRMIALEKKLKEKENYLNDLISKENEQLEKIAHMSEAEAKKQLFKNLEAKVKEETREYVYREKLKAKKEAEKEAKKIIATAIERCASEHVMTSTVVSIPLPSEEMKGRMIGREGRNIRAFESLTGADLLVDDTPGMVVISALDPIRREIAKLSLEKLILDGRIHPARIEETVKEVEQEFPKMIEKIGEEVVMELKIKDLHPELIKLLGKLKFRTSYGQNLLSHSKEVAHLAYLMAVELKVDAEVAKRAGLLHDIGKAVSQEYEGTHQKIGGMLVQRYNEPPIVVNAIEAHHKDIPPTSVVAVLVEVADTISGARPGARRETFEAYVERVEKLEEIVSSFEGVRKTYALQAGREVRVIVDPNKITDLEIEELAEEISHKIEEEMKYPGEIKVTVIREKRAIGVAK